MDSNLDKATNRRIPIQKSRKLSDLTRLERACLEFLLALLDQSSSEDKYELPLINALAVLGLTKDRFKGTNTYPSLLSSVIKISRFFVLHYSFENSISIQKSKESEDLDNIPTTIQLFSRLDLGNKPLFRLKTLVDHLLIQDNFTLISWLLDLRSYGLNIT